MLDFKLSWGHSEKTITEERFDIPSNAAREQDPQLIVPLIATNVLLLKMTHKNLNYITDLCFWLFIKISNYSKYTHISKVKFHLTYSLESWAWMFRNEVIIVSVFGLLYKLESKPATVSWPSAIIFRLKTCDTLKRDENVNVSHLLFNIVVYRLVRYERLQQFCDCLAEVKFVLFRRPKPVRERGAHDPDNVTTQICFFRSHTWTFKK